MLIRGTQFTLMGEDFVTLFHRPDPGIVPPEHKICKNIQLKIQLELVSLGHGDLDLPWQWECKSLMLGGGIRTLSADNELLGQEHGG